MYKILDLLIEVFNKGGDAKLDVAVSADRTPELTRMSPYVADLFDSLCVLYVCDNLVSSELQHSWSLSCIGPTCYSCFS